MAVGNLPQDAMAAEDRTDSRREGRTSDIVAANFSDLDQFAFPQPSPDIKASQSISSELGRRRFNKVLGDRRAMSEQDLGGFVPFNEAHAIVSAQATIQFAGAVSDLQWAALRPAIMKIGRQMDIGQPSPSFGLNVSFDGSRLGVVLNPPAVSAQQMSGLTFSIYDQEDRLVERFAANKDGIQLQSNSYIRWRPFMARFENFAKALYNYHNFEVPFALVQLEYWDRFDAADPEIADVAKIIRSDSPWIATAGPESREPWHNHTGYFQRLSPKVRRLSNIRVDYGDFPGKKGVTRSIIVYTSAQDAINAPSYEKTIGMGWGLSEVMSALERQHVSLKEDLQRIITPEAAERIGL